MKIDKLSMRNNMEKQHMTKFRLTLYCPQWSRQAVITIFPLDLDDHKNKWSRHRSFLYGCDRSPRMRDFKLGIEIPNLKQHN